MENDQDKFSKESESKSPPFRQWEESVWFNSISLIQFSILTIAIFVCYIINDLSVYEFIDLINIENIIFYTCAFLIIKKVKKLKIKPLDFKICLWILVIISCMVVIALFMTVHRNDGAFTDLDYNAVITLVASFISILLIELHPIALILVLSADLPAESSDSFFIKIDEDLGTYKDEEM